MSLSPVILSVRVDWAPIVRSLRKFGRELKKIAGLSKAKRISLEPLPRSTPIPSGRDHERRPVDLKHWTPNMPRGHEQIQQGGACVTNADDVVELNRSANLCPIRLTGALA